VRAPSGEHGGGGLDQVTATSDAVSAAGNLLGGRRPDALRPPQRTGGGSGRSLTVAQDDVPAAVERLAAEQRLLRSELADLESAWVASTANDLGASAVLTGEQRRSRTS
jgi:hypothetical protein